MIAADLTFAREMQKPPRTFAATNPNDSPRASAIGIKSPHGEMECAEIVGGVDAAGDEWAGEGEEQAEHKEDGEKESWGAWGKAEGVPHRRRDWGTLRFAPATRR